jgi:aminoglycoside/choline kinase family phosphotransferase
MGSSGQIPSRLRFVHNARMADRAGGLQKAVDGRHLQASSWAAGRLGMAEVRLEPVSGDASFRRYFRIQTPSGTRILMDAPPDREDSRPFVEIAARLRSAGLKAPEVMDFDFEHGFGLLEDFGDVLYRDLLDKNTAADLLPGLFDLLEGLANRVPSDGLPDYDGPVLQQEMNLFPDWYLGRHRRRPLTGAERRSWQELCAILIESAAAQPQVFVHKDFHSCNVLKTPAGPGLIDFQDALRGPVSYDLVSLLWDRYIAWPRGQLEGWMHEMRERLAPGVDADEWIRRCDWMGLQRNLKIVGIFARLRYRDGKQGYLEMIPQFYRYLLDVLPRYPEFSEARNLLEKAECAP